MFPINSSQYLNPMDFIDFFITIRNYFTNRKSSTSAHPLMPSFWNHNNQQK